MTNQKVVAFLPCRKGSERVKYKNTRDFAGIVGGLTKIKIQQLIDCDLIDEIIISTDDELVKQICLNELENSSKKYTFDKRPDELANSQAKTDDLIHYVSEIVPHDVHVLWTHVTSPFVNEEIYEKAISQYIECLQNKTHDSLMTVTKIQKFLWTKDGDSFNYDRNIEKWPQTQTLTPLYEVNSGIFLASSEIYKKLKDRIGSRPFLFELSERIAFDIDWEEDFAIAEEIWRNQEE